MTVHDPHLPEDDAPIPDALPEKASSAAPATPSFPRIARHTRTASASETAALPMVANNPSLARALSSDPTEASWSSSSHGLGTTTSEVVPVLCFMLGESWYGLRTQHVRQVVAMPIVYPVPTTPAHIIGVANLGGLVVPVLDLRRFLEITGSGLPKLPPLAMREVGERRMVIVEANEMAAGFPVDLAREVVDIPEADIREPRVSVGRVREFADGEVEMRQRILTLLDLPALLESARH
ncbi:MAG: chemotaxis protein CheW [Planctomycetota bacterium]